MAQSTFATCKAMSLRSFKKLIGWFELPRYDDVTTPSEWPNWLTMAHCSIPFSSHLATRDCNISVSACEIYAINCEIPSIQNAQINLAEVARCTLLVSCSTDLDCCFCRSGRCFSWARALNFKSFWTVYSKLPPSFLFIALALWL